MCARCLIGRRAGLHLTGAVSDFAIATAAWYPFTGWLLGPMIAAAAIALSSLSVLSNADRLHRFTAKPVPTPMRAPDPRAAVPAATTVNS